MLDIKKLEEKAKIFCHIILPGECDGFIDEYGLDFLKSIVIHNTDADFTCGALHACPKIW